MTVIHIVFLSLLAGFVAAGFVWYGFEFRKRIVAFLRKRQEAGDDGAEEPAKEEEPGTP